MKVSNNWKYKIRIKHLFQDKTTPVLIILLCDSIILQLTKIKEIIEKPINNICEDDIYYFTSNLEEIIDSFTFLKELANGSIPEDEWDDYRFDGNFESEFNDYLRSLYDLADMRILSKNDVQEKFMWVE